MYLSVAVSMYVALTLMHFRRVTGHTVVDLEATGLRRVECAVGLEVLGAFVAIMSPHKDIEMPGFVPTGLCRIYDNHPDQAYYNDGTDRQE